jgi:hypothetical protein
MKTSQTLQVVQAAVLVTLTALSLACGYSSKATPPAAGAMPNIAALNPSSMAAGSPAFTLTVNGTNFNSNATVNWNGAAQSTTFVSANQVTTMVPAAAVASSGTVAVTVTNPAVAGTGPYGGGGTTAETSNSMTFTIK